MNSFRNYILTKKVFTVLKNFLGPRDVQGRQLENPFEDISNKTI